ncbi:hypothetical protein WJX82_004828 [Trebouxia sp. C0006]
MLQSSTCPSNARLASGRRLQHAAFTGTQIPLTKECHRLPQRRREQLQTCAAKGKGKQGMRQGMGSQRTGPQMPPTPPVDPENVEFVLFVTNPKLPQWLPFSIVKGGRPANLLVGTMESEWGKKLFGKALIRSIAQPLWKDQKKIEQKMKKDYPPLKNAGKLQWSFKVRDKTRPKAWYEPEDLTILPEANALDPSLGEKVQTWFQNLRK